MCNVLGMYAPRTGQVAYREAMLRTLLLAGTQRGRDAWGVQGPQLRDWGPGRFEDFDQGLTGKLGAERWLVANNRAEPTTEAAGRDEEDVQPFSERGVTVAHNGTIANDTILRDKYDVALRTRIDSAVLPALLANRLPWTAERVRVSLERVVIGSWALAAGHEDDLILATNYRPLAMRWDEVGRCFWFTSQPELLHRGTLSERLEWSWVKLSPYSVVHFTPDGFTEAVRPKLDLNRVLVVCSGGMDSTVAATWWARQGADVDLLHVTYGCMAERREVAAVNDIAQCMGWGIETLDVSDLFGRLAPPLVSGDPPAPGEMGAEFAHEWVPARNLVLLSLATAWAEGRGYPVLALGNNIEEAGAYPDNEAEFIHRLNGLLPFAVGPDAQVEVSMPVGTLTKTEIVRLGTALGAPLDRTWSCYRGGQLHCGHCGPCYMRRNAYRLAHLKDPLRYAEESREDAPRRSLTTAEEAR